MVREPSTPARQRPARSLHLQPQALLAVFAGGVAGALARYGLTLVIAAPAGWPLPTLLINVVGAFGLGLLLEALSRSGPDVGWARRVRLLLGTGFLGAFTTYSSFALDAVHLLLAGRSSDAAWYLGGTLLLGAVATLFGVWAGSRLQRRLGSTR